MWQTEQYTIVVRPPVLASELSLSCTRLMVMAGHVTTLWVKRPLSVNQHGQLRLPSFWGRLNEYEPINDGLRRWRPDCCWLPVAGDWATAQSLCVQAVGGGLSGLAAQFSDESALEVCIQIMRYTDRRLYFTFLLDRKTVYDGIGLRPSVVTRGNNH